MFLMKHDYLNFNWSTMFKNANISIQDTSQPNFQSNLISNSNNSNISLGVRKIFGNKRNSVYNSNENEEVKRNIKK
jgi:hypothetical protein